MYLKRKPRKKSLRETATIVGDDAYLDYEGGRLWVSAQDLLDPDIGDHRWTSTIRQGRPSYFIRCGFNDEGKRSTMLLHRAILGLKQGSKHHCDHIDGDVFNNRRSNLRKATRRQNAMNSALKPGNNTGIPGVHKIVRKSGMIVYRVKIAVASGVNKQRYFSSFEEAVAWRLSMQKKLYKQFAPTGRKAL